MLTPLKPALLALGVATASLLLPVSAFAQVAPVGSLTLQAAIDRAMAANATIAAARLRGPINLANLAVARERLNPEGSFELEKETPKEYVFVKAIPRSASGKLLRRKLRTGEYERFESERITVKETS